MPKTIEISHRTIIFTFILILSLWFVWAIRDIILELLIAVILMTALNPLVNDLEKTKFKKISINRPLAIVFIYTLLLLIIGLFITLITQPLIVQTSNLIRQFPLLLNNINGLGIEKSVIEQSITGLSSLPSDIFKIITSIFNNVLSLFTTLVMAFYLLLERQNLHRHLTSLFSNPKIEKKAEQFIDKLEITLGGWVRAELLLMLIVGTLTYIGLLLLNIPYALPLAMVAGLLELLPNIGPTISAIPAIIVGLTISPIVALGVFTLYITVQLLENNLIVPQLMSKTVGVNPLITILVLLIGYNLGGVKGAIMAIPIVLITKNILEFYLSDKLNFKNTSL